MRLKPVARPIEPTPVMCGEDAEKLLLLLDGGASEEEMIRREIRAMRHMEQLEKDGVIVLVPKR